MKKAVLFLLFCAAALTGADDPFVWNLEQNGSGIRVSVRVQPGFYLYADQIRLHAEADGTPLVWNMPEPVPAGSEKHYPEGVWIFQASVPESAFPLQVSAEYQGCSDDGVCFLPETVTLAGQKTTVPAESRENGLPPFRVLRKHEGLASVPEFLSFLRNGTPPGETALPVSWSGMLLLALAGGVLLNFTPCVLPLIPVNLAILGIQDHAPRSGRFRAVFYGLGMTAACGLLGLAAALTGTQFGVLNSTAWFNFAAAGIFLVLALAVLEVFHLDFSAWSAKIPVRGKVNPSCFAAFLLGAMSALLAGACVAPVVAAVTVFAAKLHAEGNPAGLVLPFALGLGMALPWLLAAAGLSVLPKPGRWMRQIRWIFGILILLAAGYYAYTGFSLLPGKYRKEEEFAKLERALNTRKTVFVDFWAGWCKNCSRMERTTLRDREVQTVLAEFETVKFQAEKLSDPQIQALLRRCGVRGLPAFVLMEKQDSVQKDAGKP